MDRRTSRAQTPTPGDFSAQSGSGPQPCPRAETAKGPVVGVGEVLPTPNLHFCPELNRWLDDVPDTRFLPLVVYHKRFLIWWGISLYLFQLASCRPLDFVLVPRAPELF